MLLKVYGSLYPATSTQFARTAELCAQGLPPQDAVGFGDSLLTVSFEGIWLPEDDLAAIWLRALAGQSGKLDFLDLERWQLRRYELKDGVCRSASAPLNNVLDYSGH